MNKFLLNLLPFSLLCGSAFTQQKPNFIVILADDMGWKDLGADGSKIETPNLDRMANEGMKFTHFYSMGPMSSPTRASLLSGRYPHRVGVPELCSPTVRNNLPKLHLDLNAVTIPEALKKQGYKTMLAGKWHLGNDPEFWPRRHGFDEFWGSIIGTPQYWNPQQTFHNEDTIVVTEYFTDKIAENAIGFINANKDSSFFLYLAFNAPHYPLEAPQELIDKYRKIFDYDLFAIYAAMIDRMDQNIGKVFQSLRELGIDDNTVVFFMSDNGPSPEARDGKGYGLKGARISAGPLREHKFSTFEGGIRVPALAWWPGHFKKGSLSGRVACTFDVFPTIMDIIDADPGTELDGRSMLPLLTGSNTEIHSDLHWEDSNMWAVQEGKWKLVGRYWESAPHLYDLTKDISEQNDLAEKYPDVVRKMTSLHREWQKRIYPDPFPRQTKRKPAYQYPEK